MGFSLKTVLLRLVQGFIIGAGGILPASPAACCRSSSALPAGDGGARPPAQRLRRHLSLLLPVGAGAILGFLCGGGLILVLFDRSEKLATCLFIGLILGTLPSLWAEAGAQGRGRRRVPFLLRPAFLPSPLFCSTRSTARSTRCARASSAFSSAACFGG